MPTVPQHLLCHCKGVATFTNLNRFDNIRGVTLFVDTNHSNGSVCQIHPTAAHVNYPRLPWGALAVRLFYGIDPP